MLKLTNHEQSLHNQAVLIGKKHRRLEAEICRVIQSVDEARFFKKLGRRSLFQYVVNEMGLSEPLAYSFITVARKSAVVPCLMEAITSETLSISKASRVVSVLSNENATDVISYAQSHTTKEIDREIARLRPNACKKDVVKPLDENHVEIRATLTTKAEKMLERASSLLAQKGKSYDIGSVLESALEEFLKHHDPVEKAKRAEARKQKKAACSKDSGVELCALGWTPLTQHFRNRKGPASGRHFLF